MPEVLPLTLPGATIARQVIWLATPVLVEQSLLYLVGLSDTLLTGRYLSEDYLAAVTVASYLLWFLGSILTVVSVGATALVARRMGANQRARAEQVCQQAMVLALLVGTVTAAAGAVFSPSIARLMNLSGTSASAAVLYLRIVLAILPLLACTTVGIACLRGAGDTRTGMWIMILVNTVNVALSWSFVRGFGPFPRIGFPGIALGTAAAEGLGGLIVLAVLAKGRSGLHLTWRGLQPIGSEIAGILRISLPAAGESLTNIICQIWFLGLINRLGVVATAAHGVAIRCEAIAFLTITAFGVAASTLTGQYLGAERPDLASRAARTAWLMGVFTLSAVGILIYAYADSMFGLFLGGQKQNVAEMGAPVLRIVAFAMPGLATINVLSGALRGAGDTRWPWLFVLMGYLAVRIPLTLWLSSPQTQGGLGWGLQGAWIAMFADLYVRSTLLASRFLQGGWRLTRV